MLANGCGCVTILSLAIVHDHSLPLLIPCGLNSLRHLYVCMYACMYVCMYVCIYTCIFICMYVCIHVCIFICMYVYLFICMYVYMYVYFYVCMYVCMYLANVLIATLLMRTLLPTTGRVNRPLIPKNTEFLKTIRFLFHTLIIVSFRLSPDINPVAAPVTPSL